MAHRIDTAILHGEIDNTERGRVRGKLWLLGREEPVVLDLDGDAWRDVAGTRVAFKNPTPQPQPAAAKLNAVQTGMAGDITASRKVKVFTVPEEEWQEAYQQNRIAEVPTEWRNSLYLEWFTPEQGRCVVESADFEITVSGHEWEMDEDEEGAQKLANMQAMRDFLAGIIQRPEPKEADEEDLENEDACDSLELTEEEWEEQLKASDRLTDASMEAYEKYGEDDDSEEKTAFVMGWDHLLEDMADAQEGVLPSDDDSPEKKRRREWAEQMNEAAEEAEESNWLEEQEALEPHPLQQQARDYLSQVMSDIRGTDLNESRGEDRDHPLDRYLTNVMQISGKLAGALHARRDLDDDYNRGYVLAITKRCLNWANEALAAVQDLQASPELEAHRQRMENWQQGLFGLRDGILQLRNELRRD
ncbi:hypothetical protein WJU23_22515 [Prosthecobacter sp. SYSU 5D2]|uniref:hypothetical protein n=1 Tax=Prosthecobacter sp. SYSU 5D2 TaxID=3134134 RepID=UPI0031FE9010